MRSIQISCPTKALLGRLKLNGSKSISNRALIALALADVNPADWLSNISSSQDTATLQVLLAQESDTYDAGDAGTTYRFLLAYLSLKAGVQTLTGSPRMQARPIGPLVDALRLLGADIQYLGNEGYPPLRIASPVFDAARTPEIRVDASVSSQFLSALLLIAPYLPQGLVLQPEGPLVSRPYLDMTIHVMRHFGAQVEYQGEALRVAPGAYTPSHMMIEADWSSASYWYALAVFAEDLELRLEGLRQDSWQGDAVLSKMMQRFGIQSTFEGNAVLLRKTGEAPRAFFEQNFLSCPDIAQTLAVVCAGLGTSGLFSGLETLAIKETDRVAALKKELAKVDVSFVKLPAHMSKRSPGSTFFQLQGKAAWETPPLFETYGDHRMAMALATLGMLGTVEIAAPNVVEKSYPEFWKDLQSLGFVLEPC